MPLRMRVHDREPIGSALRRFKKQTMESGILKEARSHEHYEKPSDKRRREAAARLRKIAKAKRYAEEPERIQFTRFEATFRGENDVHTTNYDNGEWNCTCRFLPAAGWWLQAAR